MKGRVGCGERSEPHLPGLMRFVPHRILRLVMALWPPAPPPTPSGKSPHSPGADFQIEFLEQPLSRGGGGDAGRPGHGYSWNLEGV